MMDLGIYIHVPFCESKCPYCDFYSMRADNGVIEDYTLSLISKIGEWGEKLRRPADTIYFGGGTPSIIGADRLKAVLNAVNEGFSIKSPEITLEVNPFGTASKNYGLDLEALRKAGFNRISIGLQSSNDNELRLLGRLHNSEQARVCIELAKKSGFDNISLDIMLATPSQTAESLERSIEFCAEQNVQHISAYILKTEKGTKYYDSADKLNLPDDDAQADMYLLACERLGEYGYNQYEISSFSKKGYESRHNLKYWRCEEYIGIGASAHSFIGGRRFYYPRSLDGFKNGIIIPDGGGGNEEEYIMLGLRLAEGVKYSEYEARFGHGLPEKYTDSAGLLAAPGYVRLDGEGIRLTPKGFLVSNAIIAKILE